MWLTLLIRLMSLSMGETWLLSSRLRMVFLLRSPSNKVSSYGFLKLNMSSLKVAMALSGPGLKQILLFVASSTREALTLIEKSLAVGTSMVERKSPNDIKHPMIAPTKLLGGTSLLGGTEIRPTRTALLGGTMYGNQPQRGAKGNEIVHLLLVITKPQA